MRTVITSLLILLTITSATGQFRQNISTDSSDIEIIRNSVYHIYEETYKNKDSVWYSVHFIEDTLRLNTEGWKRKSGKHLGIWKEYNFDGQLLYTWDNDNGICEVNKEHFPYHDILQRMKAKSDSLVIATYSKQFFDKHVRFEYDCYAYNHYKTKFGCCEDSMWTHDYLGSWTEPIKAKPNSFKFRYQVRLHATDEMGIELGMDLDSLSNYVPTSDDFWNNYGFELVKTQNREFALSKTKAVEIAKNNGLSESDSNKIDEFLFWENFKKQQYYNGQFRYYITELVGQVEYQVSKERQGMSYKYMVYVFNPWTGEFIEKKKMKANREWKNGHGLSTGLIPDND
ncbi:MAG: hypothetical protein ACR2GN_05560 [Bacteroidia bacterium]